MSHEKLRYWWWKKQGLDSSLHGATAGEILAQSGWARSVGGVNPYLTMFSRGGIDREAVDSAVSKQEIHELPAARNCTYVVPRCDYELALRVGQEFLGNDLKTALRLGVSESEFKKLCNGVMKALAAGPLDPTRIREATGTLSRSLGEEGKKKGVATTLPIALSHLQAQGEIRRISSNGRFDNQRFEYSQWTPSPIIGSYKDYVDAYRALAEKFFTWVGPASIDEFRWFSGLGARAAREVIDSLELVSCDGDDERWIMKRDAQDFAKLNVPKKPQYALLSSLDSLFATRRDVKSFVEETDQNRTVESEKSRAALGGLSDLPSHSIFDRGRLVGLWEYDIEQAAIVTQLFIAKDKALTEAIEATENFVRTQLGDARSFSLDSPKSRVKRIQALLR